MSASEWENVRSRLNKEVKRRTEGVGVFPNDAALLRRTSCVLVEAHDEWAAGERGYLSEASMASLNGTNVTTLLGIAGAVSDGGISIDTGAAMTK